MTGRERILAMLEGRPVDRLPLMPITMMFGLAMLLLTLHGARGIGAVHGAIAKHLLVRSA